METEVGDRWQLLPPEIGRAELDGWLSRVSVPVAITGATGFIGVNLLEALGGAGMRPKVLVRDARRLPAHLAGGVDAIPGDLGDRAALVRLCAGAGTVLHLAGLVRAPDEAAFDRANRVGTATLVAALEEVAPGARLVHLSSLAATGPSLDPGGRDPDDEPRPVSAYGRSKLAGEREAMRHGGPWTVLRPPAVYGPRDIDILQFFRLVARGVVPLPSGERFVTTVYVADVVRAVLAAAAGAAQGRVLHLGEPTPRTMVELIAAMAAAGGVRARTIAVPPWVLRAAGRAGDVLQRVGFRKIAMTSDKAGELLSRHWTARTAGSLEVLGLPGYVGFAQGAGVTWAWYRQQGWVPRAKMRLV
jgi:nucleoside-diphosphate-sugar epimerase